VKELVVSSVCSVMSLVLIFRASLVDNVCHIKYEDPFIISSIALCLIYKEYIERKHNGYIITDCSYFGVLKSESKIIISMKYGMGNLHKFLSIEFNFDSYPSGTTPK
jgi:hypothetical protein